MKKMLKNKRGVWLALFAFVASTAFPQTLAEIAKKERERRESLKGKKGIVVTNADLAKLKKKPALEIPSAMVESEKTGTPPAGPPSETPSETTPQAVETSGPAAPSGSTTQEPSPSEANLKSLQEKWEKAKEYVELLTLKMGALWQELANVDAPSAKEAIQLAIAETFLKLQSAQEEEERARQELEKFLGQMKRESTPSLWIK